MIIRTLRKLVGLPKLYRVTIHLKSGNSLSFDLTKFTVKVHPDDPQSIVGLEWEPPTAGLMHLQLNQIEAITRAAV